MSDTPTGYLITIRSYGTWLAGDARGSVDDDHRTYGEPFKRRDDFRSGFQRRKMKQPPVLITPGMRKTIEAGIERTCAFRGWGLWAMNVRSNHVHLVVTAAQGPETVMRELKVYSTRALRAAGLVEASAPVWASHGSTRYAWNDVELRACVSYTLDAQGDDLPGSSWASRREAPD